MIWLQLVTFAVLSTFAVTAVLPRVLPRAVETVSIWTTERAARAAGLLGAGAAPACKFGVQPYYFELGEARTPFNVTPETWDIRAFNPRCQPQPLLDSLLDGNVSASRQLTIIVYGDRCRSPHGVATQWGVLEPHNGLSLVSPWLRLAADRASSLFAPGGPGRTCIAPSHGHAWGCSGARRMQACMHMASDAAVCSQRRPLHGGRFLRVRRGGAEGVPGGPDQQAVPVGELVWHGQGPDPAVVDQRCARSPGHVQFGSLSFCAGCPVPGPSTCITGELCVACHVLARVRQITVLATRP